MESQINKILEELYLMDPELKKEDALVRKILTDMYAVRPNITADPNFIMALRKTVLERAENLSKAPVMPMHSFLGVYNRFALAGFAVLFVAIISTLLLSGTLQRGVSGPVGQVDSLNENAFGPLTQQIIVGGRGGGGGGGMGLSMSAPQATGDAGKEMASPLIYPGPDFTQVKYLYEGGEFDLPADGFVYKRKISTISARSIVNTLKNFSLSQLQNPAIGDMTIFEDREFGYSVSINMREGWISFFQNWEKWPMQDTTCTTEECYRRDFMAPSQFPADDNIISIADSFMKEYGINMSGYGPGQVLQPWKFNAPVPMGVAGTMPQSYPPEVNVIYPLLIDGAKVYDEWGNLAGVNVYVSLKFNKVMSASNISINNYDRSKYDLVTDKNKVLDMASGGGATGEMMIADWQGKSLDVKIGTPENVYMQFYMYANGKAELMYVPALRFPVTDIPATPYFYRENVIVPLSPDIMDQLLARRSGMYPGGGVPVPMPLQGSGAGSTEPGVPSSIEPVEPIRAEQ